MQLHRRRSIMIAPMAFALTSALPLGAFAQDSTPAASESAAISVIDLSPGVTAEVYAGAPSDRAPGQTVYVARFVFQPGAEIFPHGHPGTTVLGVQSGSFGWTLVAGSARVVRGAAAGATEPTEILTEAGADVVLAPGDAIYYEDDVIHTARGAGDAEAVVLGTLVLTAGQPLLMTADQMATMATTGTPSP